MFWIIGFGTLKVRNNQVYVKGKRLFFRDVKSI